MFNYNLLFLTWGAGRIYLKFPRYFFQKFLNAFHYSNCYWNYLSCCSGTKTVVSLTDILLWVFRETAKSLLILTYKLIWFFEKVSVVKRSGFLITHLWFCFGRGAGRELSCLVFPGNWVWLLLHVAPYYCVGHPLSFPIFMK